MEQKLKERLIGAAVVVALGVVFIPVLLDGPPRQGSHTRSLPLPGQDSAGLKQVTIDLGAPGQSAPQPDPISPADSAPPMEAVPSKPVSEARTAPAPKPDSQAVAQAAGTRPVAESAQWVVQVAALSDSNNADKLAAQLKSQGFSAFVGKFKDGSRTLYRVRVGPVKTREEADLLAEQLRDGGQKVKVVPNT
jgi:DedD protein